MNQITDICLSYLRAGLAVLPANVQLKFPALPKWDSYQDRLPTESEVQTWFNNGHTGLCIVCGKVSGNLEMIDFDLEGQAFEQWKLLVAEAAPELQPFLVIEKSQSGGFHVIYRCQTQISRNLKLAQRKIPVPSGDDIVICNKTYKPRKGLDGTWYVIVTLIETRGEGGLFLCAPTPGYELMQSDFTSIPILTAEHRNLLLEAAWSLNEYFQEPVTAPPQSTATDTLRPGDDYNSRGDIRALLTSHGWVCVKGGENEYWRRPGKTQGWSATLKNRVFYVWSSNAYPFESEKAYSLFSVYTLLEHNGDYSAAAGVLSKEGYGKQDIAESRDIDVTALLNSFEQQRAKLAPLTDPGPTSPELLRIPGFVSEVMDFCMKVSAYPSLAMAFCGAVALQSFLCARKVREPGDLRTNIYLLALAGASTGKDYPRKINAYILTQLGEVNSLGDKFASGEGVQDAMFQNPCMIFQNDEIDTMLQSLNKSRDGHLESIMGTLLTMYTSSNSVYPMRRKAGKQQAGFIDQPHLTLFGTATPKYYYEALSERMLTNGFFARMIIIDAGKRATGKDSGILESMPEHIMETARWWADYEPSNKRHNLTEIHPVPAIVEFSPDGKRIIDEFRVFADHEYSTAEDRGDEVAKTVWGRANENARKLALLYACSENHTAPQITKEACTWAIALITHQIRRMLYLAQCYVSDNDFHALCLKLKQKLREAKDRTLPHSILLKRMKIDSKNFQNIVDTLEAQEDLEIIAIQQRQTKAIYTIYLKNKSSP